MNYHQPLHPDHVYHVYNRSIGGERLFRTNENHQFFLNQWERYVHPFCKTYAYCLLPDHLHFVVAVRSEEDLALEIPKLKTTVAQQWEAKEAITADVLMHQFSRLFSSYAQSYNKIYKRPGSLFQKGFKRVLVKDNDRLLQLVQYVHQNPLHHGLTRRYEDWVYSSYRAYLRDQFTLVAREEILELFDANIEVARKDFLQFHQEQKDWMRIEGITLE
ncbi:MAG: hypothetical protein AAGI23_08075 [Bacteroidota bacterium]